MASVILLSEDGTGLMMQSLHETHIHIRSVVQGGAVYAKTRVAARVNRFASVRSFIDATSSDRASAANCFSFTSGISRKVEGPMACSLSQLK